MKIFIYNYVFYSFFCLTYKNIAKRPASQSPNVPFSDLLHRIKKTNYRPFCRHKNT
jgi:hypothetical protein